MGDRLAAWFADAASRVFGPVFALEASRVGRRLSTFLVRFVYLVVLFAVLIVFYRDWGDDLYTRGGVVHPSVLTQFAENFFWVYTVTQFLVVCALTPAFTAGAITDEKERKTLDFLLVTDLSGREIVFGKLAARMAVLGTFVLAGFPVVAIMQFVGGIEPRLLFLAVGMTLATVFSLSGLSVAASVLLPRTRDAVVLAYALPAAYLFFGPGKAPLWIDSPVWRAAVDVYASGNPFLTADQMGKTFGGGAVPAVATNYIAFHAAVGVLGFVVAALCLRRSAAPPVGSAPRSRSGRFVAWVLGRRVEARRHPPVSDSPVLWRELFVDPGSGGGFLRRLLALGVLAAVILPFLGIVAEFLFPTQSRYLYSEWGEWQYFRVRTQQWVCTATAGLGALLLLRATLRGASAVAGERDRDTWTSLLATPLTSREILSGKWVGSALGQRDLLILLGGVWAVGVLTGSVNLFAVLLDAVALAAYLAAFAALGLRFSVGARNARVAIARAVSAALFLGGGFWIVLGCCAFGIGKIGDELEDLFRFLLGMTPPFVLAGLPAVDAEFLEHMSRSDGKFLSAVACGGIVGVLGWGVLASVWYSSALANFAGDANRSPNEQPPTTAPTPEPPPEDPSDSSATAAPS